MLFELEKQNIKKSKKIPEKIKIFIIETESNLKGSDRRKFRARIVNLLGKGGQRRASSEFGWDRSTIIKGRKELESGINCIDNFSGRGRKPIEEHLPNILNDIEEIVCPTTQTDPTFRTTKLYTPLTAEEVRKRLIEIKGWTDHELPTVRTIRNKLNKMNFHPTKVAKSKPKKK